MLCTEPDSTVTDGWLEYWNTVSPSVPAGSSNSAVACPPTVAWVVSSEVEYTRCSPPPKL